MTPNNRNHYEDWDQFALGALEKEAEREMAAHLASGCEICQQDFQAAQAVVAGLATLSPDEPLPEGAEMRMRKRLGFAGEGWTKAPAPISSAVGRKMWTVVPWALAAACLVAAVGLGVSLSHKQRELQDQAQQNAAERLRLQEQLQVSSKTSGDTRGAQATELQNTIKGLRQELQAAQAAKLEADQELKAARAQVTDAQARVKELDANLKEAEAGRSRAEEALSGAHLQLARAQADSSRLAEITTQNDRMIALLESSGLSQLDLKPAGSAQASARVFWQDDRGLLLVARDLPALPENGSYQLWFYRKGTLSAVNVGVVQLQRSGTGLLFVPPGPALLAMTGALVTKESESGSVLTPGQEILKVKP
ncbi:MAG: anti-sigma factor [Candidatus Acidiferrum sp.]|jgi:hypothetical protein